MFTHIACKIQTSNFVCSRTFRKSTKFLLTGAAPFTSRDNVVCLNLQNNRIQAIQPGEFRKLWTPKQVNLQLWLRLANNRISILQRDAFGGVNFRSIDLTACNIYILESEAFSASTVDDIILRKNPIVSIASDAFASFVTTSVHISLDVTRMTKGLFHGIVPHVDGTLVFLMQY